VSVAQQSGFHDGELAVQQRAGVRRDAERLVGMLAPPVLSAGARGFLAERAFAVLTGRDEAGRLWTSPLVGGRGFLEAGPQTLRVHAGPSAADPLSDLPSDQPVGLVAIDLARSRRVRVNGRLTSSGPGGLEVSVDQAYGNCPQYIQQRHLVGGAGAQAQAQAGRVERPSGPADLADHPSDADVRLIQSADTFFLGTTHPDRGSDASHRGGTPGFVRVDGADLWWPDYPGNNMFNSLGNLAVDPSAALLFVDFATGETRQLSGRAVVEWTTPRSAGDDGGTGRRVRFSPELVARSRVEGLRADGVAFYPRNPALAGR
jgi:uncharacterized protein